MPCRVWLARHDYRLHDLDLDLIIVVLVGAKLNAEMEHQTIRESTTGQPNPLGKRGARMADTVGSGTGVTRIVPRNSAGPGSMLIHTPVIMSATLRLRRTRLYRCRGWFGS